MKEANKSKYPILIPAMLSIGIAIGIFIGTYLPIDGREKNTVQEIKNFEKVLSLIKTEYVDTVNTEVLVHDAIGHMLSELDPHSVYIPKEETIEANEQLEGSFDGIGIEFNIFRDTLTVITPLSDGPAAIAGLHAGDKIIGIDSQNVAGIKLTNRDVVKRLKGPRNTKVVVEILRQQAPKPLFFTITRNKIPQLSIPAAYMVNTEIGYIKVSRFAGTTYSEFQKAMNKLKQQGMNKLILDLQGNPGGYMKEAVSLADAFLPANTEIVYTKGKKKEYNTNMRATGQTSFDKGQVIILINEGSSSASEIVSGALQDNDRALIVGRRSYGKGLVQSPFRLQDGSELRLTISRYYTPSGRSIQKPYKDNQKYAADLTKRYQRGEFFHADSIHFNDSLKYTTAAGRTVYGGGGIMPDYFVPLDTTLSNTHINAFFNTNSMQEYALQFSLNNKAKLKNMNADNFARDFEVTNTMIADLIKIGKRNNVKLTYEDYAQNKTVFDAILKANIARRVWGQDGFYRNFNKTNEALQYALKLFDDIPHK